MLILVGHLIDSNQASILIKYVDPHDFIDSDGAFKFSFHFKYPVGVNQIPCRSQHTQISLPEAFSLGRFALAVQPFFSQLHQNQFVLGHFL